MSPGKFIICGLRCICLCYRFPSLELCHGFTFSLLFISYFLCRVLLLLFYVFPYFDAFFHFIFSLSIFLFFWLLSTSFAYLASCCLRHYNVNTSPEHNNLFVHSCHPQELRNAAINYLINRINTYSITDIKKNRDWQHITTILHNNNYTTHKHQRKHKPNNVEQNTPQKTNNNKPPSRTSEKKPELSKDYLKIQTYKHVLEPQT
jgi:hypothetical protein